MESKSSTSSSQDGEAKTRQIKDEFVSHISLETRKEPFFEDVSAVDEFVTPHLFRYFCVGDTFAMTVFGSFGGFWISWGCLNLDQFGVAQAYADNPEILRNIEGFYLAGWFVFNLIVAVCAVKSTWGLFLLLVFLDLTFLMLCIGTFISNTQVLMAGGYFGILSSCCGFYSLYCAIANKDSSYLPLVAYPMPGASAV
ncbi:unnamed protein product [Saccharomyces cerevisiae]|nr:hypothetical protein SCEPF1_0075001000 [Saccharomyces cerevisiae]GMC35598.1 unnamed protein product [Saccharomyces cerevisiae]GMC39625.1 unnamed protein product [Saccharomyces cerevisiae]GMC44006.1 unnamed protein product [Saccharomyces cerevisiae]